MPGGDSYADLITIRWGGIDLGIKGNQPVDIEQSIPSQTVFTSQAYTATINPPAAENLTVTFVSPHGLGAKFATFTPAVLSFAKGASTATYTMVPLLHTGDGQTPQTAAAVIDSTQDGAEKHFYKIGGDIDRSQHELVVLKGIVTAPEAPTSTVTWGHDLPVLNFDIAPRTCPNGFDIQLADNAKGGQQALLCVG